MVNTREIAAEYRLTHWSQVMRERAASGLSIKAYCWQLGICGNTYFYWQRRVRAGAAEELGLSVRETEAPEPASTGASSTATEALTPTGWARVEPAAEQSGAVEIEVNGCRVKVTAQTDQFLLERVCRTLKSL
mgnify:CR=1 FL=1